LTPIKLLRQSVPVPMTQKPRCAAGRQPACADLPQGGKPDRVSLAHRREPSRPVIPVDSM